MDRINKISYRFHLLFKALFYLYPIIFIALWMGWIPIGHPSLSFLSFPIIPADVDLSSLRFSLRFLSCLVEMFPTAIVMLSFYFLSQLFKLYSQNKIFGLQNVILIKKIGFAYIAQVFASFITQAIVSVILTWDAPPGKHLMQVGIGHDEITNLVIGGIVVLISWVMEEGRKLEEEKNLTI